jgi:two-component system chemotaxis sensor kinase CheA
VTSAVAKQAEGDPRHVGEILVEKGTVKSSDVVEALQAQQAARGHASISESTIRVDVALLDKLMTLVGELVLARNQILQFSNVTEDAAIIAPTQRLNLITTELQEGVMKTRMQPIDNVWGKLPRTVRDLALSCGKELEIEMEGRETELDKTILEAIKDPLTQVMQHLDDINEVGRGIAVAFFATLYGVGAANLLLLPSAGKLRIRILEEEVIREMTLEGVISIMEGMNPRMIEGKLVSYWANMPERAKEGTAA